MKFFHWSSSAMKHSYFMKRMCANTFSSMPKCATVVTYICIYVCICSKYTEPTSSQISRADCCWFHTIPPLAWNLIFFQLYYPTNLREAIRLFSSQTFVIVFCLILFCAEAFFRTACNNCNNKHLLAAICRTFTLLNFFLWLLTAASMHIATHKLFLCSLLPSEM